MPRLHYRCFEAEKHCMESEITLLDEVLGNVYGGERRRRLFSYCSSISHRAQETISLSLYPSFPCAGEES